MKKRQMGRSVLVKHRNNKSCLKPAKGAVPGSQKRSKPAFTIFSRHILENRAKHLRQQASLEVGLLRMPSTPMARAEVQGSPLGHLLLWLQEPDTLESLWKTLQVTRAAVRLAFAEEEDPYLVPFLVGSILEQGAYLLSTPGSSQKLRRNLYASKRLGYFFTPPAVAHWLAKEILQGPGHMGWVADPAAGSGALLAALLLGANECGIQLRKITAVELDPFTAGVCRDVLEWLIRKFDLQTELEVVVGDGLVWLQNQAELQVVDGIVMNPPYVRAKFLKDQLTNTETRGSGLITTSHLLRHRADMKAEAKRLRGITEGTTAQDGTQNLQRAFLALGAEALRSGGSMAFIGPCAWLGDRHSKNLRLEILGSRMLRTVVFFQEDAGLFPTVNQPTAACVLTRSVPADRIMLLDADGEFIRGDHRFITYEELLAGDPSQLRLPRMQSGLDGLWNRLKSFPKIGDLPWVKNARGELDQTLGEPSYSTTKTKFRLLRGEHLERFAVLPPESIAGPGWVRIKASEKLISAVKLEDMRRPRLAGRQVAYMKRPRRLTFSLVEPGMVLGNSCNYLLELEGGEKAGVRLLALLGLLNSAVLDWFFRVTSSNNHVANYEINSLPTCLDNLRLQKAIAAQAELLAHVYGEDHHAGYSGESPIEDVLDALVAFGFGLSPVELEAVFRELGSSRWERACGMLQWFQENGIPETLTTLEGTAGHAPPTLSELDLEMIRYVPQGGNWQDIPVSVPSERLAQIRRMTEERGVVRTTYYGRLRPGQPAYTISTYYNRPGNGTNIHPWEDRTLTDREAARLQSFPDSYTFLGRMGSIRDQIGNAVPPLLAYSVGKALAVESKITTCIDLFAGAGGLSLGLELAGWSVLGAVDWQAQALATYAFNRPCETVPDPSSGRTLLLRADLSLQEVRQDVLKHLLAKLGGHPLDVLVGGPPCQGFSHAGWRKAEDSRNDLATSFLYFVEALSPNTVCLENVEGLLSYDGGRVVAGLLLALRDLGYQVDGSPWRLYAEQYGVPQMRRRVFLVGRREGAPPSPPTPLFAACRGRREEIKQGLSSEAYPLTVKEAFSGLPQISNPSIPKSGCPCSPLYRQWARGLVLTGDFLAERSALKSP